LTQISALSRQSIPKFQSIAPFRHSSPIRSFCHEKVPEPGSGGFEAPSGWSFQALELAMQEAIRLRELEAECRQRALSEPDKKWYWLAQAAKYQVQANQKLAFHSEEANAPDSPEIKLAQWSHVRDERRVMEPLPDGRRSPW
jgi:hypothetical protein